ncbi:MAG: PIN domain-containing protein [Thermoproteota archaeon]
MKSKQNALKVLLDTSFILPSLGIDTGKEVTQGLKRLAHIKAEIHISRFSILESLWMITRLSGTTGFKTEVFRLGLRSVLESHRYKTLEENSETFIEALGLYMMGHKDMIDNILYASSAHFNLKLLTLDTELKEFIREKRLNDTLISPNQIA